MLRLLIFYAEGSENFLLNIRAVNTDTATAEFLSIQAQVIAAGAHLARVGLN